MSNTLRSEVSASTWRPPAGRSTTSPEAPAAESPSALTVVGAALLVAAGLVLRLGTTSPLWLDEALSVNIASLAVGDMLDALRRDGHPPLYYLLAHAWTSVVGDGDVAVRLLSGVFGVATLPLVWAAGRRLGGRQCALAASVLYATSPFAIRYSTEARMYSLVAFLVVAGWLALRRAEDRPSLPRLALVSLVAGLLLLTHYWSFFLLAAVVAALVWRLVGARRNGEVIGPHARLVAALLAGGVLFVPWLSTFLAQAGSTGTPWAAARRPVPVLILSLEDWGGGTYAEEATFLGMCLALLAVLALFGRAEGRSGVQLDLRTVPRVRAEGIVVILTMVLAVTISYATEAAFAGRYTSVVHPLVILLAAVGVTVLPRRVLGELTVAALAVIGLAFGVVNVVLDRTQAGEVAAAIEADASPQDLVVYCPDQLGPATDRLLPDELASITFPDAGDPRFVDWVDYAAGIDAVDSEEFVEAAVQRAGTGDIWLVWSDDYRTVEGRCEEVIDALNDRRPGTTLVRDGSQYESAWLDHYPAP